MKVHPTLSNFVNIHGMPLTNTTNIKKGCLTM